ncbi:MAG TPA: sulfotransferase domain-containing protein [Acidimicrobiia bacterium]|jgi:aryl sulfotransferase|nr:sulfotransferase domain-containing protein [Acidimicrobiia bacterium]
MPPVRYLSPFFDSNRWENFAYRPDDIVISTPPKCGTTWMQMICALLILQTPTFDVKLDQLSPWLDMQTRSLADITTELDAQTHRRFIKTHTPLDGLEYRADVTYICVGRDPRDVAISWDHHVDNMDPIKLFTARINAVGVDEILQEAIAGGPPERPDSQVERIWMWVDDDTPVTQTMSLALTLHHLQTFWDARDRPNVVILHYDDLIADLEGQMRTLAARLGITVPEAQWPTLVDAARFANMRDRAAVLTPEATSDIWQDSQQFFHTGGSGQWRAVLGEQDMTRYVERARELASSDLLEWAHRPPI